MPQATEELQNKMERRFGDPISDAGPMEFLEKAGFILTKGWQWKHPERPTYASLTQDEWACILFLVQEWDFGGLVEHLSGTSN